MRMIMLAAVALSLSGCEQDPSPAEQAAQDARDVQMVKDAQKRIPPVRKLIPEPMPFAEATGNRVMGAGCSFRAADREAADPILYTNNDRAVMRLDGQAAVLAADSGSAEFPSGSRSHYNGKEYDLRLTKEPGEGVSDGEKATEWTATLTVRDRWERPAYVGAGTLRCGG